MKLKMEIGVMLMLLLLQLSSVVRSESTVNTSESMEISRSNGVINVTDNSPVKTTMVNVDDSEVNHSTAQDDLDDIAKETEDSDVIDDTTDGDLHDAMDAMDDVTGTMKTDLEQDDEEDENEFSDPEYEDGAEGDNFTEEEEDSDVTYTEDDKSDLEGYGNRYEYDNETLGYENYANGTTNSTRSRGGKVKRKFP